MKRGKKVYDLLPASEGDVSKMFRKAVRSTFSSQSTNEDQSKIDILDLVASTSSSSTGDAQKSALNRKVSSFLNISNCNYLGIFYPKPAVLLLDL